MARNEEKQYGKLNRLYLFAEKEKHEKLHPTRPKLDSLHTVSDIQMWLPSIKQDLDFYLKKSQVTCYSDRHIEECREKVFKLEKEFKAFVRKIKQLSGVTTDPIPWTNRAYKRKSEDPVEMKNKKVFEPIACPILEKEKPNTETPTFLVVNSDLMDKPLCFKAQFNEKTLEPSVKNLEGDCSSISSNTKSGELSCDSPVTMKRVVCYDSSDSDCD